MQKTTNYNLDITEGTDIANVPISQAPNIRKIDEVMKTNESNGFSPATELLSGTVHNLTRSFPAAGMIRWIAAAPYAAGDTFTVDGVAVTARTVSGENLPSGAYIIGQCVQAFVDGANMTVFVDSGNARLFNNKTQDYFQKALANAVFTTTATSIEYRGTTDGIYIGSLPPDHSTMMPFIRIDMQDISFKGKTRTFISGTIIIELNRNYIDNILPANAEITVHYRSSRNDRFGGAITRVYKNYPEYRIIVGAMPGEYVVLCTSLPQPNSFIGTLTKNYIHLITMDPD